MGVQTGQNTAPDLTAKARSDGLIVLPQKSASSLPALVLGAYRLPRLRDVIADGEDSGEGLLSFHLVEPP